jgi:hypothetical protein
MRCTKGACEYLRQYIILHVESVRSFRSHTHTHIHTHVTERAQCVHKLHAAPVSHEPSPVAVRTVCVCVCVLCTEPWNYIFCRFRPIRANAPKCPALPTVGVTLCENISAYFCCVIYLSRSGAFFPSSNLREALDAFDSQNASFIRLAATL